MSLVRNMRKSLKYTMEIMESVRSTILDDEALTPSDLWQLRNRLGSLASSIVMLTVSVAEATVPNPPRTIREAEAGEQRARETSAANFEQNTKRRRKRTPECVTNEPPFGKTYEKRVALTIDRPKGMDLINLINPLHCHADRDGECEWADCPQLRDEEPDRTGRHCPLDNERGSNG